MYFCGITQDDVKAARKQVKKVSDGKKSEPICKNNKIEFIERIE